MIRNIVFDMGQVLIRFDPEYFMNCAGIREGSDRRIILKELFHSVEWSQMDLGILTEETAEPVIMSRIPDRLKTAVSVLLHHWADYSEIIPGMEELLIRLRNNGYNLYLLSNASVMQHSYWPTFTVSRLLTGKMVSCDVGAVKPDPVIYSLFTEKFGLDPEECLFVDDQPANVAAALRCGWSGCVFYGEAQELGEKLARSGIRIN